jgi:hypothetical protein
MVIQRNVSQRFRRPEDLYFKAPYAKSTKTVNNYRNRNALQKVKTIPVKRIATHNAYDNIRKVAADFAVPCVKKTVAEVGKEKQIVRVCCRTIQQLDNIGSINS